MNGMVKIVDRHDLKWLISHEVDRTMVGKDRDVMVQWLERSEMVWVGMVGKDVLCYWGLIPPTILSDQAYLWLYTTPAMQEHQFMFVRHSQRVVAEMLKKFPTIVGHCDITQSKSMRWMRWLGAVFGEPTDRLIPFVIRAK